MAGQLSTQGISFVIGIFLARILNPSEYGLIGMAMVFVSISGVFIDGGFSTALIRKKDPTQADLSTVFYINIGVAVLFYILLYLTAPFIANFYGQPVLTSVTRVISLNFVISAACTVQVLLFVKRLDFKTQSIISIVTVLLSGIVGLYLAYASYGVMALVIQSVAQNTLRMLLLWVIGKWRPAWVFSIISLKRLFSFGSKLFLSGLISRFFDNLYPLVIGRFFSPTALGYYTRAENYQGLLSRNLTSVVNGVSFPSLVQFQNDDERLKAGLRKMNNLIMMVNIPLMVGLALVAKPLIVLMITDKWLPVVPYLQWLCVAGILYPLHVTNLNVLNVKGRSDLFLRLEIIKKALIVFALIIGSFWGVKGLVIGQVVFSIVAFFINVWYPSKLFGYNLKMQLGDLLPFLGAVLVMAMGVWSLGFILEGLLQKLIIQAVIGILIYWAIVKMFKFEAYSHLKELLKGVFIKS